jgi:hypothetical protein
MPQFAESLCDAMLDAWETNIGASPTLRIYNGQTPANCAAADVGTEIVSIPLPSDWMSAASGATKEMLGSWTATAGAANTTNPLHYRIKRSGGSCAMQGSVTQDGGITLSGCATTLGNQTITVPANSVPNGARVTGSGILSGTYLVSGGGTTSFILSTAPALTLGSTSLTFTGEMTLQNINIVVGQTVNITSFEISLPLV